MENQKSSDNKAAKSKGDIFQFNLRSLNDLLKIAETNKGYSAGLGKGEAPQKSAQRTKKDLYQAFGCSITKLGSNPAILTSEGHELVTIAMKFHADLEAFKRKCAKLSPKVIIAAGDSVINWVVLPAINKMLADQPNLLFAVRQGGTKGLIELLQGSQVDFIIVPENAPLQDNWKFETIGKYEYAVCCPNELLNGRQLSNAVLSTLNFAMITKHWELDFVKKAEDEGINLKIKIRCETFTQIASLVKQGFCAGVLPTSTIFSFPEESFSWINPIFTRGIERKVRLVWKPEKSQIKSYVNEVAGQLIEHLRSELEIKQK